MPSVRELVSEHGGILHIIISDEVFTLGTFVIKPTVDGLPTVQVQIGERIAESRQWRIADVSSPIDVLHDFIHHHGDVCRVYYIINNAIGARGVTDFRKLGIPVHIRLGNAS